MSAGALGGSAGTLPAALLELARAAAAAGAAVLAGRNTAELDVSNKGDSGDWVTAFDLAAETAVRDVITGARPDDTITGEEGGTVLPASPSGYRWSIDPLDGTTNFIRNIVYYGTSVAVADPDGVWLAGVVDAPALGRRYYALRGHGAWLEEDGRRTAALRTRRRAHRADPGHRLQLRPGRPGRTGRRAGAASWTASPTSAASAPRPWTSASWRTEPMTPTVNGASTNTTSPPAP